MTGGRFSGCGWAARETTESLGFGIDRVLKDVGMCDVAPDLIRDDGGSRVRLRVTSRDLGTAAGECGPVAVVGTDAGLRGRCPQ